MVEVICIIIGIIVVGGIIIKILSNPLLLCLVVITIIAGYIGMGTGNPIALIVFAGGVLLAGAGLNK